MFAEDAEEVDHMTNTIRPLVVVSSYLPRQCEVATFVAEFLEFMRRQVPDRPIHIICHKDGQGDNVHPIIDLRKRLWHEPVAELIKKLDPYVVHIQHEYSLYEHVERGRGDNNKRLLELLDLIRKCPTVVEAHSVYPRLKEREEDLLRGLLERATVVVLKSDHQKWSLGKALYGTDWKMPHNVTVIPYGARPDRRHGDYEIDGIKDELGVGELKGRRVVGLVGWTDEAQRWDVVLGCWEEIQQTIFNATGESWLLCVAGDIQDERDKPYLDKCRATIETLEQKGLAKFLPSSLRSDTFYKVMTVCDFVVLPATSGSSQELLARAVALNKPFVAAVPLDGLALQAIESEGGLLFTDKASLKKKVVRLACDERVRRELGENLKRYLDNCVSWDIIIPQYLKVYEDARQAVETGKPVDYPAQS